MQEKNKINLAGIDSLVGFAHYAAKNRLGIGMYYKISNDGTIREFLITVERKVRMVIYNPDHSFYFIALEKAENSENTYIEGV